MSDFTIIENNRKGRDNFGHNYGSEDHRISKEDIQALLDGKALACEINGGEYTLFIEME